MKQITKRLFIVLLLLSGMSCLVFSQEKNKAYFLDGDEVVFVFDVRDYESATDEGTQETMDFADIDIYSVAVTGQFSDWGRKGWAMKRTGEFTFQLRKPLAEFQDRFPFEFKYIINEQYWAEPGETFPTTRKFSNDFFEETYNLTLYDVLPSIEGNSFFFLPGNENAQQVILTGTFVSWDEEFLEMQKVEGGWQLRLDLLPDRYEYKFIIDGVWTSDPENPNRILNEHGTYNSILQIAKSVNFELDGFPDATNVSLCGTFNRWSHHPMQLRDGKWEADLAMPHGKYHYKYVVDGKYIVDPGNPLVERSNEGMSFSVKIVQ